MWIFTQDGYISVVQHFNPTPGAELLMRSRSAGHLYDLLCLVLTEEEVDDRVLVTPDHDYPYRILVSRELFGQVVAASMARLDYSNFKARCSQTLGGADAGVLNRIWAATHGFTDNEDLAAMKDLAKGRVQVRVSFEDEGGV